MDCTNSFVMICFHFFWYTVLCSLLKIVLTALLIKGDKKMTPVLMCAHHGGINQWSQIPCLDPCALSTWELIYKIISLRVDKMKFFFLLSFSSMFLSFTYHLSAQQSISDHLWDSNPAAMAEEDNNKETFWTQWVVYHHTTLCYKTTLSCTISTLQ